MQFQYYDLGHQKRGAVAVVTLKGSAANVRLMNSTNYSAYKAGRRHTYIGGLAKTSPARLAIPSDGRWYVTVDLQGLSGTVRSGISIEPPPLPALPPMRAASRAPLMTIRENAHPVEGPDDAVDDSLEWDVFICHASEDKEAVASPLAEALRALGVKVWLDDLELRIGDSLRRKIDQGLSRSRFGAVVFSRHFFAKQWPQYELDGLVTRQNSGEQVLLPIWHEITKAEVVAASPSLADKIARSTTEFTIQEIAEEIASVVRPTDAD